MKRRHLKAIAAVIVDLPADIRPAIARRFAAALDGESHFKRDRFMRACRVAETTQERTQP